MVRLFSHKNRPVHLGSFPLERLPRSDTAVPMPPPGQQTPLQVESPEHPESIANAMRTYIDVMDRMRVGPVAPEQAPVPSDPQQRADHLKAAAYYLDASMAGVCEIPSSVILDRPVRNSALDQGVEQVYSESTAANPVAAASVKAGRAAWQATHAGADEKLDHPYALVILCEYVRDPSSSEAGAEWIMDAQAQRAALRAAEVGAVLVNYLRMLGFEARLHTATATELDIPGLIVASGLGETIQKGDQSRVDVPYLGNRYGAVAIATTMALTPDRPLAPGAGARGKDFRWWLGVGGTRPGYAGEPYRSRAFHKGIYPMETLKRVDEPTTLINSAAVPRVPKRHDMFIRAGLGDLGEKAEREMQGFRMITKSPFGHAMIPVLGGMVPLQFGQESAEQAPGYDDPVANAERVKAALYYLGADMVGICEIPDYAWYSHDVDGSEIKPYHRYAICILIDQGYETMEGASGDDWISGAQSMRAYMRAQLLGGVVGSHLRSLGFSARGHSVMDQDVLHIPLNLLAGLGELPRIGEMVLNPFVGPRFKSGILTTNMPLAVDKPIDFGMQDFCNKCLKCARECPCQAIPFGDKIMFNGYEIWKPDVEKCARYRVTNAAGSLCGRCMKTCPYNLEGIAIEKPFLSAAMHLPGTRKWLADLDDKVGNGVINPIKKWWWDLDTDEDGRVVEAKRSNQRGLSPEKKRQGEQKLACYPQDIAPQPIEVQPVAPDRKQGMVRYQEALSPDEYRRQKGGQRNA